MHNTSSFIKQIMDNDKTYSIESLVKDFGLNCQTPEVYITKRRLLEMTDTTNWTIYYAQKTGWLTPLKNPSRQSNRIRYRYSEVQKWIEAGCPSGWKRKYGGRRD